MRSTLKRKVIRAASALFVTAAVVVFTIGAAATDNLTAGKVDLKSAGPLSFGPDGILFIGDSVGGSVVALDTGDRTAAASGSQD